MLTGNLLMWSLYSLFVSKHQVSVTKLLPPVSYLNHKQDFRSYILISRHDGISASSQCHTYMLAGGTEPLSIRDQHERRPQTGSVVSTVTRVTQQDLRTHTHILNSTQTSRDGSFYHLWFYSEKVIKHLLCSL